MRKIKILSIVLSAITFALSFNLCAGATTIEDFYKSTGDGNVAVLQETSDITETLVGSPDSTSLCELSKPTTFYNLSKKYYKASMQCIGTSWLYTNYYFKPNSNKKINVNYSLYSTKGSATNVIIGIFDLSNNSKLISKRTISNIYGSGKSGSFSFTGLNKSHKYTVAFCVSSGGWSVKNAYGSAKIYH